MRGASMFQILVKYNDFDFFLDESWGHNSGIKATITQNEIWLQPLSEAGQLVNSHGHGGKRKKFQLDNVASLKCDGHINDVPFVRSTWAIAGKLPLASAYAFNIKFKDSTTEKFEVGPKFRATISIEPKKIGEIIYLKRNDSLDETYEVLIKGRRPMTGILNIEDDDNFVGKPMNMDEIIGVEICIGDTAVWTLTPQERTACIPSAFSAKSGA